jgi:hypothetical protein
MILGNLEFTMEVKDYSQKLDSAREKYREAATDLKKSYDKDVDNLHQSYEHKLTNQSKNYDKSKSDLEEQNAVNNEFFSNKTKETISKRQDDFRNEIKQNVDRFSKDREKTKMDFDRKLTDISDSFKKSSEEKDKYHSEAKRTLDDRYQKATTNFEKSYRNQLSSLENHANEVITEERKDNNLRRNMMADSYQKELDGIRTNNREEKFKEVSRLANDNQNLRTNFALEKATADEERDARINDIIKNKNSEAYESQKNFSDLQDDIRSKNLADQENIKASHLEDTKNIQKRFSDDLKNIQRVSNQKITNGTEVESLKDENNQLRKTYENRLTNLKKDNQNILLENNDKMSNVDDQYKDTIKNLKQSHVAERDKSEREMNDSQNKILQGMKEKNASIIDRYKTDNSVSKNQAEQRLSQERMTAKSMAGKERIEFGKVVNTLNEKNIETISTLKNEFAKDKTEFIEKSKRDFNIEKTQMKDEFNNELALKDQMYNGKFQELENQTARIIDNYENRLEQLARKNDKEMEMFKIGAAERMSKEVEAYKTENEMINKSHQGEVANMRDKFERIIARDRTLSDQQATKISQKYEDQLERERFDHQRELSSKLTEAQAQFERLFKASELEKETMRNQYESRMENMKLSASEQQNSKKA